ncbi:universal stress protein [Knoellia aerolata]|uniref:Universal stress protein n=1 Tax=Knoellia aerolata DSM 18566 TaxID=1385519 RepID=A0A0A0JX84_9MICO|nr:universal stress protein [Knoellia aerolata]KGN40682.1 universal stress protein [Knoellia aerolata DSM 18566]
MNTPASARPVVVGFDGSPPGDAAFAWAVAEATRRDLPLHVLVARGMLYPVAAGYGLTTPWPEEFDSELVDEARERVAGMAPERAVVVESVAGTPASFLVDASREAELVVVGRRRQSALGEAFSGSTSSQVAAHASCPVVVVDKDFDVSPQAPIVVAVDGSSANDPAVGFAFERAAALGASVTAVHSWWVDVPQTFDAPWLSEERVAELEHLHRGRLDVALAGWSAKFPEVEVRTVLRRSLPVEAVLAESEGAQLIVVGSRGHGGFVGLLLGSVSQGLLHRDRPCPIAVVHALSAVAP